MNDWKFKSNKNSFCHISHHFKHFKTERQDGFSHREIFYWVGISFSSFVDPTREACLLDCWTNSDRIWCSDVNCLKDEIYWKFKTYMKNWITWIEYSIFRYFHIKLTFYFFVDAIIFDGTNSKFTRKTFTRMSELWTRMTLFILNSIFRRTKKM